MPRKPIPINGRIVIYDPETSEKTALKITSEPRGQGSSCIVYEAVMENSSLPCKYRLKELYPEAMENSITRASSCQLIISGSASEKYAKASARFEKSLELLWQFAYSDSTGCYTVCPLGKYFGEETNGIRPCYLLTQWMPSDSIDTSNLCRSGDLFTAANICLKTAVAAAEFHRAGYINLDIKPENILYSPKTDTIAFFDTDTIFRADCPENENIYYSQGAAPEIVNGFSRLYSEKSDVFSIGSMLHRFITGENYFPGQYSLMPESSCQVFSEYEMCRGVNPRAISVLTKIFSRCSPGNPHKRCSDSELAEMLSELAETASSKSIYALSSSLPPISSDNIYADELYSIRKSLSEKKYLIIRGLHNSGKTELAKCYAAGSGRYYHTVVWADFCGSMEETISRISFMGINDDDYSDKNKLFEAKLNILKKYDKGMLLIIDGCNDPEKLSDRLFAELDIHILVTSACSGDVDKNHIYIMKSQQEMMVSPEELDKFSFNMNKVEKTNRSLKLIYNIVFIVSVCLLIFSAASGTFLGSLRPILIIISILLCLFFKSFSFKCAEKEATAYICRKYCRNNYKAASEFGNMLNNNQLFELSAPEFVSSSEGKRHLYRIISGLTGISAGIVTGLVSLYINSFPFLVGSYMTILLCIFASDYFYSMSYINKRYNDIFGSANNEKRSIKEIYSFKSSIDGHFVDDEISPECAKHIIYHEYKMRCNIWGTTDVAVKFDSGFVILSLVMHMLMFTPNSYFRIPDALPEGFFTLLGIIIFSAVSAVQISRAYDFYFKTKELLFTVYSENRSYVSEKFRSYLEDSVIGSTALARGIYGYAVERFEQGIPIYEIRRAERPTFSQYCTTQRARSAVYFLLSTSAVICITVWHYGIYSALIPILAASAVIQLWWFFWGMYFFNRKSLAKH